MATEIITSFQQICDSSGDPVSGAKVYVYDINSTTPQSLFSDAALGVTAANPIVCDSAGRHDMRYKATGSYKIVVKTSAGSTIYTRDYIDGRVPVGSGALAIANGGTGSTSAAAALAALGGATAAELAAVSAEVASISGALGSTEKTHLATGTTLQRPGTPVEGDVRRNTTTHRYEGYNDGAAWETFFTNTEIASAAEALAGSDNTKVMTPARVRTANAFQSALLHVQDQKAANTAGGTFTSGALRTRTLNTSLTNEISGASLGSNQITLPSGTYYIEASVPASAVNMHKAILRNTTDSTTVLVGTSAYSHSSQVAQTHSLVTGRFTIAAQKVFEIEHICSSTFATSGFGEANNLGSMVEVFTDVKIWKVA